MGDIMKSMTVDQERHLARIKSRISQLLDAKYRIGQAEHKSNLWKDKIMPMMIEEIIDLVSYGLTMEEHIEEVKAICTNVEEGHGDPVEAIKKIKVIL